MTAYKLAPYIRREKTVILLQNCKLQALHAEMVIFKCVIVIKQPFYALIKRYIYIASGNVNGLNLYFLETRAMFTEFSQFTFVRIELISKKHFNLHIYVEIISTITGM